MKLILIPLIFLILLGVSIQFFNFQTIGYTGESGTVDMPYSSGTQIDQLNLQQVTYQVTVMGGLIILFMTVIGVGILSGLNISLFGSTIQISQRSQNLLFNALVFGGIWGIFSTLAIVGVNNLSIFSVPVFGALLYFMLTLIYVLGVVKQIQGGG